MEFWEKGILKMKWERNTYKGTCEFNEGKWINGEKERKLSVIWRPEKNWQCIQWKRRLISNDSEMLFYRISKFGKTRTQFIYFLI